MFRGYGGTPRGEVDDAEGTAVRDVGGAVSHRFVDGEVVEEGVAAVMTFMVEGKQRGPRSLEGAELIAQVHLPAEVGEGAAVEGIGVVSAVVVVIADET